MKKLLLVIGKVLGILAILFIFLLFMSYVNHQIQLSKEEEQMTLLGDRVEVNGHSMHVYSEGEGDRTLLFMSGGGTSSPVLDFKSLYSNLSDQYKIIVVEKVGYGNSEVADVSRDIASILSDTRESLHLLDHQGPFVLLPHSMSGLEALYWAQTYPQEVDSIIGLDMAVPKAYDDMLINMPLIHFAKLGADLGITRFIPGMAESDAIKFGNLTEEEKELYRAIFYRRTSTITMLNEIEAVKENAKTIEKGTIPDLPFLVFASNGEETGFASEHWQQLLNDFIQKAPNGQFIPLDSPHYIHNHEPERIAAEIQSFLDARDFDG